MLLVLERDNHFGAAAKVSEGSTPRLSEQDRHAWGGVVAANLED